MGEGEAVSNFGVRKGNGFRFRWVFISQYSMITRLILNAALQTIIILDESKEKKSHFRQILIEVMNLPYLLLPRILI